MSVPNYLATLYVAHDLDPCLQTQYWGIIKYYINDVFSVARVENISWYKPYCQAIPTDQAKILHLWDGICLPHVDKIQVAGRTVTILEFEVDANAISVYLSVER